MALSDKEIEDKIEKTVFKLEKFYKIYNIIYKVKSFFQTIKEKLINNFFIFLIIYTFFLYFIFRAY